MAERRTKRAEAPTPIKGKRFERGSENGVSVIVCTNRPEFLSNILANYERQLHKAKEFVIVLNNNKMNVSKYRAAAKRLPNVKVYQMDESISLGKCLNFAISKTTHPYIAKFDDDDYYSPYYLNGVLQCFNKNQVDVIGKNTCYLYLESKHLLVLFHPDRMNRITDMVMGSTLAFRRTVFDKVRFRDVSVGEDTHFFTDCTKRLLKIYSCDPFNYVCIRRSNRFSHTWSIDEQTVLEHSVPIAMTQDFTLYSTRAIGVSP